MFDIKQFLPRCIPRRTHTRTTSVLTAPDGSGCGFANAPPAVHFAVFRYPQRQLMQDGVQKSNTCSHCITRYTLFCAPAALIPPPNLQDLAGVQSIGKPIDCATIAHWAIVA